MLKILHDPKYLIPWELWDYSRLRSCRIFSINSITSTSSTINSIIMTLINITFAISMSVIVRSCTTCIDIVIMIICVGYQGSGALLTNCKGTLLGTPNREPQ